MTTIEDRIKTRQYSSPVTARAGILRSKLSKKEQLRMNTLVDDWEEELAKPATNGHSKPAAAVESAPGFEAVRQAHSALAKIAGLQGCSIKRLVTEVLAFNEYIGKNLVPKELLDKESES